GSRTPTRQAGRTRGGRAGPSDAEVRRPARAPVTTAPAATPVRKRRRLRPDDARRSAIEGPLPFETRLTTDANPGIVRRRGRRVKSPETREPPLERPGLGPCGTQERSARRLGSRSW